MKPDLEVKQQLKTEARRASSLSRQALKAAEDNDYETSRKLLASAVIAGKKCQVLLHENNLTQTE